MKTASKNRQNTDPTLPCKKLLVLTVLLAAWSVGLDALAQPSAPDEVNYQGVLRDAAGAPLDGSHDMTFRFYDDPSAGSEMLVDRHTAGDSTPVVVSDGLFNVVLGTGAVSDGTGPGTFASLSEVFAAYADIWMRVEVGGEVLAPRVKIAAAPYSLNAGQLGGQSSGAYLRSDTVDTFSGGEMRFANGTMLVTEGNPASLTLSGQALDVTVDGSLRAIATVEAEELRSNESIHVNVDSLDGTDGAVVFHYAGVETESLAWDDGLDRFLLSDNLQIGASTENFATLSFRVTGDEEQLMFSRSADRFDLSNDLILGEFGAATSTLAFRTDDDLEETLTWSGSRFDFSRTVFAPRLDSGGNIYVRSGGPDASSSVFFFEGTNIGESLTWDDLAEQFVLSSKLEVPQLNSGGNVHLRINGPDGNGSLWFYEDNTAFGERLFWNNNLDRFETSDDLFVLGNSSASGAKNFVQNHPHDENLLVVYTALEGDEPATFTRGTARLEQGVARIALSESFGWVTHPDLGLTAHLTPREGPASMWVESLTPHELVVRADAGDGDVRFDYVVMGLRLGFEEHPVLQQRTTPAPLPSPAHFERLYADHPEWRAHSPASRHVAMLERAGEPVPDMRAADALRVAAGTYDPGLPSPAIPVVENPSAGWIDDSATQRRAPAQSESQIRATSDESELVVARAAAAVDADPFPNASWLPVSEPVVAGDVLALDPERSGVLRRASSMADATIIGVALGAAVDDLVAGMQVPLTLSGVTAVQVDAGYAAIEPGDLLTASPTPGHAMRAMEPLAGTILGKAIEGLDAGTGAILVAVAPH